jgi:hypothetical protein
MDDLAPDKGDSALERPTGVEGAPDPPTAVEDAASHPPTAVEGAALHPPTGVVAALTPPLSPHPASGTWPSTVCTPSGPPGRLGSDDASGSEPSATPFSLDPKSASSTRRLRSELGSPTPEPQEPFRSPTTSSMLSEGPPLPACLVSGLRDPESAARAPSTNSALLGPSKGPVWSPRSDVSPRPPGEKR